MRWKLVCWLCCAHPRARIAAAIATQPGVRDPLVPNSEEDVGYWFTVERKRRKTNESELSVTTAGAVSNADAADAVCRAPHLFNNLSQASGLDMLKFMSDARSQASTSSGYSCFFARWPDSSFFT